MTRSCERGYVPSRALVVALGALLGVAGLSACSSGTPSGPTGVCMTDAECEPGQVCRGGQCALPSASDGGGQRDGGPTSADGGTAVDGGAIGDAGTAVPDAGTDAGTGAAFGERCNVHSDCRSQICLQVTEGSICSVQCSGDCPTDYVCKGFVLDHNRIVNLCVPYGDVYCQPCTSSAGCVQATDRCSDVGGANYCTKDCSQSGLCPPGFDCLDVPFSSTAEGQAQDGGAPEDGGPAPFRQCLPHSGKCPGCIDRDGDGYGIGAGCRGPDCNDHDPNIHPGAPELCDGIDNNCDGRIDEGFDLQTDGQNCGRCGVACNAGADDKCCAGQCARTNVSRDHCGACGARCNQAGQACCTGACEDTRQDPAHCGSCSTTCTNEHGGLGCEESVCRPSCAAGFGDCDFNPRNGCETALTSLDHCGACNRACLNAHGETRCANGDCAPTCQPSFGDCDTSRTNGCETSLLTTTEHCGACDQPCVNYHGTTSCGDAQCRPVCALSWGDCNGNPRDGCETDTSNNRSHCGGCGLACVNPNGTTRCGDSLCKPTCSPGYGDCNGNSRDGCETALATVEVCGSCNVDEECPTAFFCNSGVCTKKRGNGGACAAARECQSAVCTDGVCCNTDCTGTCRSCKLPGSVGLCTLVPNGTDPENECEAQPIASCGRDGTCDGFGACRLWVPGSTCVNQSCQEGVQTNTRLCDGFGTCSPALPPTTLCSPFACEPGGCRTRCTIDNDCAGGFSCAAGQCKVSQGLPCQNGAECATGSCTDGVCCNALCDGLCERCNLPGTVGSCEAVPAGADPDNECDGQDPSTCGRTGACSGTRGRCQIYPSGTICRDQSCATNTRQNARSCDGNGTCVTPTPATATCVPFGCNAAGSDCLASCTQAADCSPGYACAAGVCKRAQGTSCGADTDCASGFCASGVCCESRCGGSCERCNGPARAGFCDTLPSPANLSCASAQSLGAVRVGEGLNSGLLSIANEGETHWFVVTFPMSTLTFGGGASTVQLLRNDSDHFRLQVVGSCTSQPLTCTSPTSPASAATVTSWSFGDDQSPAGPNQWQTRNVSWPTEVYFRVTRTSSGRSCDIYQVRISR